MTTGASYTDVNAVLPAKTVLAVIAVLCAVLFFAGADPRRRPGQRVAVGDRVVGRDVAGDLRVQLLPQLVAKHLRVLVADTHLVAGGGVRRGPGRGACVGGGLMAGCAGREQRAGTQQQRDREGDEGSR